jgi:hypothetical protein
VTHGTGVFYPNKFQTGSIIDAIEDDILLDDRLGWIHEVVGDIILTWHRNGQHYLVWERPWWFTSAIRAPGTMHEGTGKTTTTWIVEGLRRRPEGGGGLWVNGSRIKFFSRIGLCAKIKTLGKLYARMWWKLSSSSNMIPTKLRSQLKKNGTN